MLCFFYVLYLKTHNLLFVKSFKNFACQLNSVIKVAISWNSVMCMCIANRNSDNDNRNRFFRQMYSCTICWTGTTNCILNRNTKLFCQIQCISLIMRLSWHVKFLKDLTKSRLWVFKYNTLKNSGFYAGAEISRNCIKSIFYLRWKDFGWDNTGGLPQMCSTFVSLI